MLFIGCKSETKYTEGTYESIIQLDNELGNIKIRIPNSLDTNKKTFHFSDYYCGDNVGFIFYNKKLNHFFPDTTWEFGPHLEQIDSVDIVSLGIGQSMHTKCDTTSKSIDESYLEWLVERQLMMNQNTVILEKELVDIENGRMAIIMYSAKIDSMKSIRNINAMIIMNNEFVSIWFSQILYNNDSLSAILYDCIKRIEIEE